MRRREFIAGLVGAAVWPLAGWAQLGDRVRRIEIPSDIWRRVENALAYAAYIGQSKD